VNYLDLRADGTLDPKQKARILGVVREAARQAKFVIVYQHNHFWNEASGVAAPPNRNTRVNQLGTAPWLVAWTHELIDAGASLYVAHGNPVSQGVEIYKGRPILYSLGNYIFNQEGPIDVYGPLAYYSVVAYCDFVDGKLAAVRFRPLVLSLDTTADVPRGIPYLAQSGEASVVLERLARLSQEHGTKMTVEAETASVVLK
jgi:poly-gamma-glutamate synthesis protein (capsule biosynthesis protein)